MTLRAFHVKLPLYSFLDVPSAGGEPSTHADLFRAVPRFFPGSTLPPHAGFIPWDRWPPSVLIKEGLCTLGGVLLLD